MEKGTEAQTTNEEALKERIAIQCAKASILISSLSPHRRLKDHKMKEIEDLRVELARERLKNKRIKLCGLFEFFLQLAVLFSLFAFFQLLVLRSR